MLNFESFRVYAGKCLQIIRAFSSRFQQLFRASEREMPALHEWSLRGNVPTIRHLIEHDQVDVNETYSSAKPESNTALSYAASAGHKKAIETLMSFGAIDSNDIKIIGHCLGLRGDILLKGKKKNYPVSYESFNETYTLPAIAHHLELFNQIVWQQKHSFHVKEVFSAEEKSAIQMVTNSFWHYLQAEKDFYLDSAKRYQQGFPTILRCSWPNHTGFALLYKNRLYICDRGIKFPPGINCYQIDSKKLKSMSGSELATLIKNLSMTRGSVFSPIFSLPEFKVLNARHLYSMRMKRQKQLNCTYANIKRGVGVILQALKDDKHRNIDVRKIYKSFTYFDKFQTVDEHVEKYRHSTNKQAFEPLIKYLSDKTIFKNKLKIALSQHILSKLRASPINMSDEEIATAILTLPYSRPKLWDLYSYMVNAENLIFQTGNRLEHLCRLLTVVPHIRSQRRIETLQAAQLGEAGLAILHQLNTQQKAHSKPADDSMLTCDFYKRTYFKSQT